MSDAERTIADLRARLEHVRQSLTDILVDCDEIIASRDERHYLTTITSTRMLVAMELEALDAPAPGGNAP